MRIGVDLRRLDPVEPRGLSSYSLPLTEALIEADPRHRYEVLWPGSRSTPSPGLDLLLVLDGSERVTRAIPSIVLMPDLGHLPARAAYRPGEWLRRSWAVSFAARRATHLVTPSESVRSGLTRYLRVPPDRVTAIPPASTVSRAARPQVAAARAQLELPARYLVYVGTLRRRKNLELLLRAWQAALSTLPSDVGLVVAGAAARDGEAIAASIRAAPRCRWLGYVQGELLAPLLTGAIAYVNPSLYEGSAQGALEAMACTVPPLVAATGALPEMVGSAGLVLDPHDHLVWAAAIALVVREEELRAKLGRNARAASRRFRIEESARALAAVLDPAASGDPAAAARAGGAEAHPGAVPGPEAPEPQG